MKKENDNKFQHNALYVYNWDVSNLALAIPQISSKYILNKQIPNIINVDTAGGKETLLWNESHSLCLIIFEFALQDNKTLANFFPVSFLLHLLVFMFYKRYYKPILSLTTAPKITKLTVTTMVNSKEKVAIL